MTKASGDGGVDLILLKDGIKTAVQCKRYSGNVGVSAIQEVYAEKTSMVVTQPLFLQIRILPTLPNPRRRSLELSYGIEIC